MSTINRLPGSPPLITIESQNAEILPPKLESQAAPPAAPKDTMGGERPALPAQPSAVRADLSASTELVQMNDGRQIPRQVADEILRVAGALVEPNGKPGAKFEITAPPIEGGAPAFEGPGLRMSIGGSVTVGGVTVGGSATVDENGASANANASDSNGNAANANASTNSNGASGSANANSGGNSASASGSVNNEGATANASANVGPLVSGNAGGGINRDGVHGEVGVRDVVGNSVSGSGSVSSLGRVSGKSTATHNDGFGNTETITVSTEKGGTIAGDAKRTLAGTSVTIGGSVSDNGDVNAGGSVNGKGGSVSGNVKDISVQVGGKVTIPDGLGGSISVTERVEIDRNGISGERSVEVTNADGKRTKAGVSASAGKENRVTVTAGGEHSVSADPISGDVSVVSTPVNVNVRVNVYDDPTRQLAAFMKLLSDDGAKQRFLPPWKK